MTDTPRLMTDERAEEYLEKTYGYSYPVSTLRQHRTETPPRGPAIVRIGRRVFYTRADLDAWMLAKIEAGRVEGGL